MTDFGISVHTNGFLLSTRENRGTDEYTAPEIRHASPGIPTYWFPVDIYALGLILYEVFTGHRVFYTRAEALALPPLIPRLFPTSVPPGVTVPTAVVASSFVTRVLSKPCEEMNDGVRALLAEFGEAVRKLPLTDRRIWRDVEGSVGNRCEEINGFLRIMLDGDPVQRPGVEILVQHFRANHLRCLIECDLVPPLCPSADKCFVYFVFLVYFVGEVDQ